MRPRSHIFRGAVFPLTRPPANRSRRAQPKPPCGRFSAACGRCGGAAAPPGLRPKPILPRIPLSTRKTHPPHRLPIPAAANRSHRAQPKPPAGRFSAACGRCGGAAAPPGLRPKPILPRIPLSTRKTYPPRPLQGPPPKRRPRPLSSHRKTNGITGICFVDFSQYKKLFSKKFC